MTVWLQIAQQTQAKAAQAVFWLNNTFAFVEMPSEIRKVSEIRFVPSETRFQGSEAYL